MKKSVSQKSMRVITFSVIGILLSTILIGCNGNVLRLGPEPTANMFPDATDTKDGWTLSLFNYKLDEGLNRKYPVLMLHGLNYNNFFWDLDENYSLAQYLSKRGYDVWTLSLRGAGWSTKPGVFMIREIGRVVVGNVKLTIPRPSINPLSFNWSVDDYIQYDLPAAIEYVKKQTGKDKVNIVAHSMGGIITFAYCEQGNNQENINGIVALGTALTMPQPPNGTLQFMDDHKTLFKLTNAVVSYTIPSTIGGILDGEVQIPMDTLYYNSDNMDKNIRVRMFYQVVEDVPDGVLSQYFDYIESGDFKSKDKKYNYAANLQLVHIPVMLIAGKLDNLAPPEGVRYIYKNVSSQDKTFRLIGRADGFTADYGHTDLILGRNAKKEIYPLILYWLNKRN